MKNVGDYIVYQKDVCKIVDRKENAFSHLDCIFFNTCSR